MEITVQEREQRKRRMKMALLTINCILLSIGNCGGPLIMRFYFNSGGKRIWFSSFLQTVGFPIVFFPVFFSFFLRRKANRNCNNNNINIGNSSSNNNNNNSIGISIDTSNGKSDNGDSHNDNSSSSSSGTSGSYSTETAFFLMKPRLFTASAVIGVLTGLDNYLYAYGLAYLPVSTSSLIIAAQLAFTALFAFFMVKQKFTPFSINAVVLLTVGAGILALNTNGDKPAHESSKKYMMGFLMTVAAAVLYAFILPLVELTYKKARQAISYTLVLEIQLVMCAFATAVCAVGMFFNRDFQAIAREARESTLGEPMYYVLIVFTAIVWQGFSLGAIGIIFCASSLVSGILISVLLPITEILAVVFFHEKFGSEKAVSLLLSLWGFASYFYGEMKLQKKQKKTQEETQMAQLPAP